MVMEKFKFLPHTADIKFRAFGKNQNELFENCALAVSEIISRENKIKTNIKKRISVEGHDKEELLYNFIEELLYLLEVEKFVVSNAKVSIKDNKLEADIYGDYVKNYKNLDHIKSPTYHEMYIKKNKKGWEAQVVVDV